MSEQSERAKPFTPRLPAFYYGGDYNPEQWLADQGYTGETVMQEDLRLMRLAHVNVVSLGVFSWVTLQPAEQTYSFDWLDRVMDALAEQQIFACLATATAAQPAWFSAAYPDALPVNEQGLRLKQGGRQNYCPTSPDFRRLAQNLVRRLAERYRDHPALLLWHVSNEYGPSCYCDRCAERFRLWLQERYGSLDQVNRHWVTRFWGHTYTDWKQIIPPGQSGDKSINGLMLDYQRFLSDMNLECYRGEVAILRAVTPGVPATTNLMGPYKPLDYSSWAPYLDIVAWDSYPQQSDHPSVTAFKHDLMRGLKPGQPWLLMEQSPSQATWMPRNVLKRPGEVRMLSYQALARGADGIMYFQWRQSRGSAEMYHGAIVSHVGHEHTRVFQEVAELGAELDTLGSTVLGTRVVARVALLFSWPNWWNLEYRPAPDNSLRYVNTVLYYYRSLWKQNVAVDVISPDQDLSGYELVIAPLLNMVTAKQAVAIGRYVENGGTFVASYFSSVVGEDGRAWLSGYPGPLRKTLGIWVEEFDPLATGATNHVLVAEGGKLVPGSYSCKTWCDLVHLEGATALATYGDDFYAGRPAITEHAFGKGRALYVATHLERRLQDILTKSLLNDLSITAPLSVPVGVEVTRREDDGRSYLIVLNHNTYEAHIALPSPLHDLLSGETVQDDLVLPVRGVALLTEKPNAQ